jgi:hypothetical protein
MEFKPAPRRKANSLYVVVLWELRNFRKCLAVRSLVSED